jgi:hypothetical protein
LYNEITGSKISPFSYPSGKNAYFRKTNKTTRPIFICIKTDGGKKNWPPEFGRITIYGIQFLYLDIVSQGLASGPTLTDGTFTQIRAVKTPGTAENASLGKNKVQGTIFNLKEGDLFFKKIRRPIWPLYKSSGD